MSIQCGVDCLDCKAPGPPVGDGGYLGAPILEALEDCEAGDPMPSFGWFYEPISLLGMRRYDLEGMKEFLAKHNGHRLYLSGDHDSEFPPELIAMQEEDLASDDSASDVDELDRQQAERTASGEFTLGVYEVVCLNCSVHYSAGEPELLRSFEQLPIEAATLTLFLDRWGSRDPDDGWNHRLCGLVDPFEPFMEGLPAFMRSHQAHRLEARLTRQASLGG